MSILLEALRKSEKNQRAHEVPTIHADDEVATAQESLATGPLAILLVSTLFISGWFVWQQYQAPPSSARPGVADTQAPAPEVSKTAVGSQSAVAVTQAASAPETPPPPVGSQSAVTFIALADNEAAVTTEKPAAIRKQPSLSGAKDNSSSVMTPEVSKARAAQVKSANAVTDKSAGKQRTPMESYKAPVKSVPKTSPANTEHLVVTPPAANATETQNKSTYAEADVKKPVAATRPKPPPEALRPIGYWELPDSVRANIPEIKFSVLVYATNPSDRFVLISGERLLEGDSAGSGLIVKEIRRDGVIFSYRKYQFLVEK